MPWTQPHSSLKVMQRWSQTAGLSAEELANFIVRVVNDYEAAQILIDNMIAALETCLQCKALDWSAEHDIDITLRRARAFRELLPSSSAGE
jgi:Fe-S oxidoreductase